MNAVKRQYPNNMKSGIYTLMGLVFFILSLVFLAGFLNESVESGYIGAITGQVVSDCPVYTSENTCKENIRENAGLYAFAIGVGLFVKSSAGLYLAGIIGAFTSFCFCMVKAVSEYIPDPY